MASAFASQLTQIAAASTNELDLKAQKATHSESLLFEKKLAGGQEFDTIYQICREGFQDLCQLDAKFNEFEQNLFSAQSKNQDRTRMTAQENQALDTVLERFLCLVGGRLLLRPALKSIEWLIRRFKIHTYNTSFLLSTFLPYYDTPIFRNILSIMPTTLPTEYKSLTPYLKIATNPPRHAIVYSLISSDALFNAVNAYTIKVCRNGAAYPALLSFWSAITIEAINGRLNLALSGRKEIQRQRQEDVLLQVLPLLKNGFAVQEVPEMTLACYTFSIILVSKSSLTGQVLDSLMEEVVSSMNPRNSTAGIQCLTVLANQRGDFTASKSLVSLVTKVSGFAVLLAERAKKYPRTKLLCALIRGCLRDLQKKKSNYASRLSLLERLLLSAITDENLASIIFQEIFRFIFDLESLGENTMAIKSSLAEMLRKFDDSEDLSRSIKLAAGQLGSHMVDLETMLGRVIANHDSQVNQAAIEQEENTIHSHFDELEQAIQHLPDRTVNEHTFLVRRESHLFTQLREAFQICCDHENGLVKFQSLQLWQTSSDIESVLYISFLLRIACGPYSDRKRSMALMLTAQYIESHDGGFDTQALLPYLVFCLADGAQIVRKAASEVIQAMETRSPVEVVDGEMILQFGKENLYEVTDMANIAWISSGDFVKLLQQLFLPMLEECVLDFSQIGKVLTKVLNSNSMTGHTPTHSDSTELKKPLRQALFNLITSHLIVTPLYCVKVDLVHLLAHVEKVGSKNKTRTLIPVLEEWASLSKYDVEQILEMEKWQRGDVNIRMAEIISSKDKDIIMHLKSLLMIESIKERADLVDALFARVVLLWKELRSEIQVEAPNYLFELLRSKHDAIARNARHLLLSVSLPNEALVNILEASSSDMSIVVDHPPPSKRRRISHEQAPAFVDRSVPDLETSADRLTFALELIDSNKRKDQKELLSPLLQTLNSLQRLHNQARGQLPYLQHLCLGNMLTLVRGAKSSQGVRIDFSKIPVALLIDCIRSAENPQVQGTALLLAAELATVVPDRILHHLMPVFTFIGKQVLSKDDEHSINVINSVIDQVIPPMVKSLSAQKKDITESTSELLSSFCRAFDDVPQPWRLTLFHRLVSRVGPESALHTVISMLVVRHHGSAEVISFVGNLMNEFMAHIQLSTIRSIIDDVRGLVDESETSKKILFDSREPNKDVCDQAVRSLLLVIQYFFKNEKLKISIEKRLATAKDVSSDEIAFVIHSDLSATLAQLLALLKHGHVQEEIRILLESCITSLFNLLPFSEHFNLVAEFLEKDDIDWQYRVLYILNTRLQSRAEQDSRGQRAAVEFLPVLIRHLEGVEDDMIKQTIIASVDNIMENCGRKYTNIVLDTVRSLLNSKSLNSTDGTLETATILCMASVVEILKEAVIPVLSDLMPRIFEMLNQSMLEGKENFELHNAAYSLLAALFSHVPYMISDEQIGRTLLLSAESANTALRDKCKDARRDTFSLISRKLEIKQIIPNISQAWNSTIENGIVAVRDLLQLLSQAIDRSPKYAVVKNADSISAFVLQIMDLRRIQLTDRTEDSYTDDEISAIENSTNELVIKFIYKLNDTVFRPLFLTWIDWATKCPGINMSQIQKATILRQTTLFNFIAHFFTTLKSIVTSYTAYILEPAIQVLNSILSNMQAQLSSKESLSIDNLAIWKSTLSMLRASATHDQDSFFTSSSQLPSLATSLISHLTLASSKTLQTQVFAFVIPTIVCLAAATIDNTSHHKIINHVICQLRHAKSPGVRLASIRTQLALSESDDVGEEWTNNLVSQGGEAIVYVNEMLEDDDEEVEREVRKWVRLVREMAGEDVFEA